MTLTADVEWTPRERDVAGLLAQGKSNLEIAASLAISEHTVRAYVRSMQEKTRLDGRAALGVLAIISGMTEPEPQIIAAISRLERLTERQREVALLVALGKGNKEIAETLGIGESTVKWHIRDILAELRLCSRYEVAACVAYSRRGQA